MNPIRFRRARRGMIRYLKRTGRYAQPSGSAAARLILLDLNMPRKTGGAVLKEIKIDPDLRTIPGRGAHHLKADEAVYAARSRVNIYT